MDKLKLDIQMFSSDEEEKTYGYDDDGCKYQVYSKDNFMVMKGVYVFTKSGSSLAKVSLILPEGWNTNNTRVLELRETFYQKQSDGTLKKLDSEITNGTYLENGNLRSSNIYMCHSGYSPSFERADIYYEKMDTASSSGEKIEFEFLLMKVDI